MSYAPKVYLAGPITGLNHKDTTTWRDEFTQRVKGTGIVCFSPMRGKDHLNLLDKEWLKPDFKDAVACSKAIMTRDRFDCMGATLVVMNLLREYMPADGKVSCGSLIELGWADACRVPVIGIVDPMEKSAYNHPMVNEAIGFRVSSVQEAAEMAKIILVPG